MKKTTLVLIMTVLLSLINSGCKNKKIQEIIRDANINGTWTASAYGISAVLKNDEIIFYQTTSDYCQKWDFQISYKEFVDSSKMSSHLNTIISTFGYIKQPGIEMKREVELPASCSNGAISQRGDSDYQFDPQQDLDIFWQTFNEHYAFFDIEEIDWDLIYTLANAEVDSSTTEEELFEVLSEMIEPLKDFHSYLYNESLGEGFSVSRKQQLGDIALEEFVEINEISDELTDEQFEMFELYFEEQFEISMQTIISFFEDFSAVESNQSETVFWGVLPGNIGYVMLSTMDLAELGNEDNSILENTQVVNQIFDDILESLEETNGIIVDVRVNGGGDDFVGRMLTSRLIDSELFVYSKQARLGSSRTPPQRVVIKPHSGKRFTGPVAILTSTTTSSAAETFALTIRARENSQLIGEATGGGFSDILPKSLPHGMEYGLSNEIYISADGMEFEGIGVPVDQEHPFFSLEQRESETDLGLVAAMDWIISQM